MWRPRLDRKAARPRDSGGRPAPQVVGESAQERRAGPRAASATAGVLAACRTARPTESRSRLPAAGLQRRAPAGQPVGRSGSVRAPEVRRDIGQSRLTQPRSPRRVRRALVRVPPASRLRKEYPDIDEWRSLNRACDPLLPSTRLDADRREVTNNVSTAPNAVPIRTRPRIAAASIAIVQASRIRIVHSGVRLWHCQVSRRAPGLCRCSRGRHWWRQ